MFYSHTAQDRERTKMMYSLKTLVSSSWILVMFLLNLAEGRQRSTSSITNSTSLIKNATSTLLPTINTTAPGDQIKNQTVDEEPMYVIKSRFGEPCILATFNITIMVSYYVKSAKNERKYIAFKDIKVPNVGDTYDSVCGENRSSLILEWGNSTFNLNMTFLSHGKSEERAHSNWTLNSLVFGYNVSNVVAFPGSSEDDYVTLKKDNLELFNTVIGHTMVCDNLIKKRLGEGETETVIKFEYVKIAAFNLTSETFPEVIDECQAKTSSIRDEDIMVPLIIACALSFVIIVVVVAYAISRKVQEARDQSQYKPMP